MPLPQTTRQSLVDQAIAGIRSLLETGEWPVGTRIPPEPALAAELGVSRNTVREAVRALAHAGLLEVRRGDGTYVRAASEVSAVLGRHLQAAALDHVLEVRHAVETQAAVLAADRRTGRDLTTLEQALAGRAAALQEYDAQGFVDADVAFHVGVVAAAHNPLLVELYEGFVPHLHATVAFPDQGRDDLCSDHVALFAAIRDQDPAAAAEITGGLLRRAGRLGRPEPGRRGRRARTSP